MLRLPYDDGYEEREEKGGDGVEDVGQGEEYGRRDLETVEVRLLVEVR